jgi:hypothetical protein
MHRRLLSALDPILFLALAFLALALLAPAGLAQVHEQWVRTYNAAPTGHDQALAVAIAPSGSVYSAGETGTHDAFVLKYDSNGSLLWARTFALAGGLDGAYDIAIDPSNESVYAVGRGDDQFTRALALKYDAAGNLLWSSSYNPAQATAQFYVARLTPNGNLLAAGSTAAGLIVIEYDPQGNVLWNTLVPGGDYPADVAFDGSGDVLLVGSFDEVASTTRFGVSKLSPTGNLLWTRTVAGGGSGLETAHAVAADPSGAIYAAGRIIDAVSGPNGALVKLDSSGNVLWMRAHRGTMANPPYYYETLSGLAFAPNGNVRVGGMTANAASDRDVQVFEYTPSGQLAWQGTWDGPASDFDAFIGMTSEADGSLTVLARTEGTSENYDPVVLRWGVHGGLRWAKIDPVSASVRGYVYYGAFGPGGARAFVGRTPPDGAVPSNALTLEERDQAIPFCAGDGSSGPCPCGNQAVSGEGQGCVNSLGDASRLVDSGDASLGSDTLVLTASGEVASTISIFLQGGAQASPSGFGDGLRCIGGGLARLYVHQAQGGVVAAPHAGEPSVSARSAALGDPIAAGTRRFYQVLYRDNVSSFCPPPGGSTFNTSSALAVLWAQ